MSYLITVMIITFIRNPNFNTSLLTHSLLYVPELMANDVAMQGFITPPDIGP